MSAAGEPSPLWAMGGKPGAPAAPAAKKKGLPAPAPSVPETIRVSLPVGTLIRVQLNQALRASVLRAGATFPVTLKEPLTVGGQVLAPMGSLLDGVVYKVIPVRRFWGGGTLELSLTRLVLPDQKSYPLATEPFIRAGKSHAFRNLSLIAGGGIVGVGVGSLLGQMTGALIGMGIGGGTGGILAWVTVPSDISLAAGTELVFKLSSPVTFTIRPTPTQTVGPK
jgi:hypothetical protein